jgi:hypothetical protein
VPEGGADEELAGALLVVLVLRVVLVMPPSLVVVEDVGGLPVAAAARTLETLVQAGFLLKYWSYMRASPVPGKVPGTQEYLSENPQTVLFIQSQYY